MQLYLTNVMLLILKEQEISGVIMITIFMDESGYTGEDLMNSHQLFFTLATLRCSEEECKEYKTRFFKKVQAPELKHDRLVENRSRQRLMLEFLQEISQTPDLVKIHVIHKRYELTSKIVQYVVKPAMMKEGVDIRLKGQEYLLTYSLYNLLPLLAGQRFFEDLLRRFQNMMIRLNHDSYHRFFDPLFDVTYPQLTIKEQQETLDQLLGYIKAGYNTVGYNLIDGLEESAQALGIRRSRPLDPAFSTALTLIGNWQRDIAEEIVLIHDASSRMAEVINLLHTFVHPFPPPTLLQFSTHKMLLPIAIGETYSQDSRKWIGLQLADILAGATTWWIKWIFGGRKLDDQYGKNLDNIIPLFQPSTNKPVVEPTLTDFEELGLTEEEAQILDDYHEKIAAFHRIRKYGYFRIFDSKDQA
jgi:hypothetical protein